MMMLGIAWFALVAFLFCIYYVLDGFDLGAAILSPFVAKTEQEKRALVKAIGPVWDGNEVWLLAGGGALFAAFAPAYATAFSGFYLAIMLVLFGLIVRAELRMHDAGLRRLWDALFFVGSLLPALLYGVALGNCLQGVPLDANGDYTGGFLGLLRPFPLLCGVLGLATIVMQGAAWLAAKIERGSELQKRARHTRLVMQIVTVVVFAATSYVYLAMQDFDIGGGRMLFVRVGALALAVVGIVVAFLAGGRDKDVPAFLGGAFVCVALMALFAATVYPDLIVSTGAGPSISIANAQASHLTLSVMGLVACVGLPLVLVYHAVVYYHFRGRVPIGR